MRVIIASDENWPAVVANLRNPHRQWGYLSSFLGQEGADPQTYGTFYKEVVQVTLLFGVDTWFINPRIGRTPGDFHHKVYQRLAGIRTRQDTAVRWV